MSEPYETLDEYLDALDAIKAQVAKETHGMTVEETQAYFSNAEQRLQAATGKQLRVRRVKRRISAAKQ
jgi:hypothetical protein